MVKWKIRGFSFNSFQLVLLKYLESGCFPEWLCKQEPGSMEVERYSQTRAGRARGFCLPCRLLTPTPCFEGPCSYWLEFGRPWLCRTACAVLKQQALRVQWPPLPHLFHTRFLSDRNGLLLTFCTCLRIVAVIKNEPTRKEYSLALSLPLYQLCVWTQWSA